MSAPEKERVWRSKCEKKRNRPKYPSQLQPCLIPNINDKSNVNVSTLSEPMCIEPIYRLNEYIRNKP